MRIKARTAFGGDGLPHVVPGQELEVPEAVGKQLIADNKATEVKGARAAAAPAKDGAKS